MDKAFTRFHDWEAVIQAHNPFYFYVLDEQRQVTKQLACFNHCTDAYYDFFKRLWWQNPRGFVDVPLFIIMNTPMTNIAEAERFVKRHKIWGVSEMIQVGTMKEPNKVELKKLAHLLHQITGSKFRGEYFMDILDSLGYDDELAKWLL